MTFVTFNSYKVSSKNTCGYSLPFSSKTHLIAIVIKVNFSDLFNGKSSSELDSIFT